MKQYKIYWEDLNEDAQKKLLGLYHDNVALSPLAIIDIEEEEKDPELLISSIYTKLNESEKAGIFYGLLPERIQEDMEEFSALTGKLAYTELLNHAFKLKKQNEQDNNTGAQEKTP